MKPQVLDAHVAWPCDGAGHAFPHVRQLVTLVVVSTQLPLHIVGAFCEQPLLHVPDAQIGVFPLHELLHRPHVAGFDRSASQPSSGFDEQCANPAAHEDVGTTHFPALHVTWPLTCGSPVQSCAHAPQCFGSLASVTSQPLPGSPSQSAVPGAQVCAASAASAASGGGASPASAS